MKVAAVKVAVGLVLLASGSVGAFTSQSFNVKKAAFFSTVAEDAVTASGLKAGEVRRYIKRLNKDNFSSTLTTIEPYLLNEVGASAYSKLIKDIWWQAKNLGVELPTDYAKEAKATAKRRSKQDAFIQKKLAEAAAKAAEDEEARIAEKAQEVLA